MTEKYYYKELKFTGEYHNSSWNIKKGLVFIGTTGITLIVFLIPLIIK